MLYGQLAGAVVPRHVRVQAGTATSSTTTRLPGGLPRLRHGGHIPAPPSQAGHCCRPPPRWGTLRAADRRGDR